MVKIRPVQVSDGSFLWDMLYEMVHLPGGEEKPDRGMILGLPEISKYLDGYFHKLANCGMVAEDAEGRLLGAAWFRLFDRANKGYGYIADDIPELAIAIVNDYRGQGLGSRLIDELVKQAKKSGYSALSLSVTPENPACRLYLRKGFQIVSHTQTSLTMQLELKTPESHGDLQGH